MQPKEVETAIGELEERVDRLRILYDQYFLGYEKLEPMVPRKDVERRIMILRKEQIRNTAIRWRFNVVNQKFNTYSMYWQRIARQIEEGTFKRHLQKAKKILDAGLPSDERKKKTVEAEIDGGVEVDMTAFDVSDFDAIVADTEPGGAAMRREPAVIVPPEPLFAETPVTPFAPPGAVATARAPQSSTGLPPAGLAESQRSLGGMRAATAPAGFRPTMLRRVSKEGEATASSARLPELAGGTGSVAVPAALRGEIPGSTRGAPSVPGSQRIAPTSGSVPQVPSSQPRVPHPAVGPGSSPRMAPAMIPGAAPRIQRTSTADYDRGAPETPRVASRWQASQPRVIQPTSPSKQEIPVAAGPMSQRVPNLAGGGHAMPVARIVPPRIAGPAPPAAPRDLGTQGRIAVPPVPAPRIPVPSAASAPRVPAARPTDPESAPPKRPSVPPKARPPLPSTLKKGPPKP